MFLCLNLFEALKIARKVIYMNWLAPNLQFGAKHEVRNCTRQFFLSPGTNSAKKQVVIQIQVVTVVNIDHLKGEFDSLK